MKVLFLEHDHASPPGPVAERFAQRGYHVTEVVVVTLENFHSPNVEFTFPDSVRVRRNRGDGGPVGRLGR